MFDPPPFDWISGNGFQDLKSIADEQTDVFELTAESLITSTNEEQQKQEYFFRTLASEQREMFSSSCEQVLAIESFEDLPLVVIASGNLNPMFGYSTVRFQEFWNEQCQIRLFCPTRLIGPAFPTSPPAAPTKYNYAPRTAAPAGGA